MSRHVALFIAALVSSAFATSNAAAQGCPKPNDTGVCQTLRESRYTLRTTNAAPLDLDRFLNASVYYEVKHVFDESDTPGSNASQVFGLKTGWQNFVLYGDPSLGITVSSSPVTDNLTLVSVTNAGPGGSFTLTYDSPLGANFAESWIRPGVHNNHYTLDFNVGGFGGFGVLPFSYILDVKLPGNWSSQGIGTGRVEWVTLPSASMYSIDNDFVFDGSTTNLFVTSGNWDGASAGAEFRLYGAVVPEPSTLILTGIGGLALVGFARRRGRTA